MYVVKTTTINIWRGLFVTFVFVLIIVLPRILQGIWDCAFSAKAFLLFKGLRCASWQKSKVEISCIESICNCEYQQRSKTFSTVIFTLYNYVMRVNLVDLWSCNNFKKERRSCDSGVHNEGYGSSSQLVWCCGWALRGLHNCLQLK